MADAPFKVSKGCLMKIILLCSICFFSSLVFALIPETTLITCNEAQGFVSRNRVINMTTKPSGYIRYVADENGAQCFGEDVAVKAYAPTLDEPQCHVGYVCVEPSSHANGL